MSEKTRGIIKIRCVNCGSERDLMINCSDSTKAIAQEIVNLLAKENCTIGRADLILQFVREVIQDTSPIISVQLSTGGLKVSGH